MEKRVKAKDILKNNETAVMIFTDGRNLEISENGHSKSGVWVINKYVCVEAA